MADWGADCPAGQEGGFKGPGSACGRGSRATQRVGELRVGEEGKARERATRSEADEGGKPWGTLQVETIWEVTPAK